MKNEVQRKREVGLWIDHSRAVIVTVTGDKEETRQVRSNIRKFVYFSGGSGASPLYGTCNIAGKGKQDREFGNFLSSYFQGVASLIRHADSIWIFGPGKAKGELEKYLPPDHLNVQIVGNESMDKLTNRQITAMVRQHYNNNI